MKKLVVLSSIIFFAACGLQVRDNPSPSKPTPNTSAFTVGGTAVGIPYKKGVKLSVKGNTYTIDKNGSFTFPLLFTSGTSYDVNVVTGPGGAYACTLQNDTGTVTNANVTNVILTCSCDVGSLGTGTGTSIDPINVYTANQLQTISTTATASSMSKNHKQQCDLDYTGIQPKPIGKQSLPFTGKYDGNEFFILNYASNDNVPGLERRKGLFGYTKNARLENIYLSNFSLEADPTMSCSTVNPGRMGALAGTTEDSSVENIYGEKITAKDMGQYFHGLGGLIGSQPTTLPPYNSTTSTTCTTNCLKKIHVKDVDLFGAASEKVGGIIGWSQVDGKYMEAEEVHVHSCKKKCGGVVGMFWYDSEFYEINALNVTVEGNERVGGVTGESEGESERNASVGTVNGLTTAGGFAGIVGYTSREIRKSYTSTDVLSVAGVSTAPNTSNVGRVYGLSGIATHVSYDSSTTCQNCTANPGTTSRPNSDSFKDGTDSEMSSWNFATVWCLVPSDYPHLQGVPFSVCQ